jgi:hypothetical protein
MNILRTCLRPAVSLCICAPLVFSAGCGGSADGAQADGNGTSNMTGAIAVAWNTDAQAPIAGYMLHYGTESSNYPSSVDTGPLVPSAGGAVTYTINGLVPGRVYYIAATAYDASRAQSPYSNEVSSVAR